MLSVLGSRILFSVQVDWNKHGLKPSLWHHFDLELYLFFSLHDQFHRQILGLTLCFNSQHPVNNFWYLRLIVKLVKYDGDYIVFTFMFIPSPVMHFDVLIIVVLFTVVYMYHVIIFSRFYWGL